ncbi:MAG: hypothetical protein GWP91_02480 [Rhodobacterales bacterium]|nr:hypothetical protein [Rhodobacterales bacterium]
MPDVVDVVVDVVLVVVEGVVVVVVGVVVVAVVVVAVVVVAVVVVAVVVVGVVGDVVSSASLSPEQPLANSRTNTAARGETERIIVNSRPHLCADTSQDYTIPASITTIYLKGTSSSAREPRVPP